MALLQCFVYILTLTLVQLWYPEKKGLASGIVSMVFGLSAAIMSPLFGKMLASLGYVSMNLSVAVLTLIIGLAGAYFARAPDAVEKSPSSLAAKRQYSGEQPLCLEVLERASERSLTVKESMQTRSFWFLWTNCMMHKYK